MSLDDSGDQDSAYFEFAPEAKQALSLGSRGQNNNGDLSVVSRFRDSLSVRSSIVSRSGLGGRCISLSNRPRTAIAASAIGDDFSLCASTSMATILRVSREQEEVALTNKQSPSQITQELERDINSSVEQSILLRREGKLDEALESAKEGTKKEQLLRKHRKANSLSSSDGSDLMHSSWFNLAMTFEAADMPDEAIKTYTYLAKQRGNPFAGRLRINMGNVYYRNRQYPSAITQYKMALDICSGRRDDKSITHKIRRNIGNALFRLGKMRDSVQYYEGAMNAVPDYQTGFNLLVCHLALGDIESVKHHFITLVEIQRNDDDDGDDDGEHDVSSILMGLQNNMKVDKDTRLREANHFLLTAARLIAPKLVETDIAAGYDWVCAVLDAHNHEDLASKVKLEQATQQLKRKEFGVAVKTLKSLQKKRGNEVKAATATNLAFVSFLEGKIDSASSQYSDIALGSDNSNNAKALVNKGNCLFVNGDFTSAKVMYQQAIGNQADCVQALYNLGLANAQLGLADEAIDAFEMVNRITPNDPRILYQIADIYELQGRTQDALKWFSVLAARVNDPEVLTRLGQLHSEVKDESQSLHHQMESFRHYPTDLDVISSLGTFFVKQEMYERSLYFFQQALLVQPKEIKWGFAIASAHKRCGEHDIAFHAYQKLYDDFPENEECLRHLISSSETLGQSSFKYQEKLDTLLSQKAILITNRM